MATRNSHRTVRTHESKKKGKEQKTSEEPRTEEPRSLAIADRGIKTGSDFADMMSALMSDLIAGRVTPQIGNATCNAGGKLLKIVDMQYKYGTTGGRGRERRNLVLALEEPRQQLEGEQQKEDLVLTP